MVSWQTWKLGFMLPTNDYSFPFLLANITSWYTSMLCVQLSGSNRWVEKFLNLFISLILSLFSSKDQYCKVPQQNSDGYGCNWCGCELRFLSFSFYPLTLSLSLSLGSRNWHTYAGQRHKLQLPRQAQAICTQSRWVWLNMITWLETWIMWLSCDRSCGTSW